MFLEKLRNLAYEKLSQSTDTDIVFKILKENADHFGSYICDFFNDCVKQENFLSFLKLANITQVFKEGFKGSKDNYRPVSILPTISKIFEKLLCKQIILFIDPVLSNFECGFRKEFGVQDCLLAMLEHWKSEVGKKRVYGVFLTDLSKAFDCLSHELIIAKVNAYGFSLSALKLIDSYLSKKQHRTKINQPYSTWEDILFGVPQDSIINDLFLVVKDVIFC